MNFSFKLTAFAIAVGLTGSTAFAVPITTQTFDTDPPVAENQAPGVWYEDRYAPAGFSSETFDGDERLRLRLSETDGATSRPGSFSSGFYNTQGRKYDIDGATMVSIDMYIAQEFASETGRVGGLWGTAVDSVGTITSYPIVEFIGGAFSVWDGVGSFVSIGTPTGFTYDSWINLSFELDTVTDRFTVSAGDLSMSVDALGSVSMTNAILQGINTDAGINRDIYFDNFTASATAAAVPLPAGLPILLSGLGAFAFFRTRRSA